MNSKNVIDISSHPDFRATKNKVHDEYLVGTMSIMQQPPTKLTFSERILRACEKREGFLEYLHDLGIKKFYLENGFDITIDPYPEWLAKKMIKDAAPKSGVE